jgi:hypothetical protein
MDPQQHVHAVPGLVDARSRITCAIGLPVSRTSRTGPSLKSLSNFLRVSPSENSSPLRGSLHAGRATQLRILKALH